MSGSGETASGSMSASGSIGSMNNKAGIIIISPEDESTVDTNEITVEGKIVNSAVEKVTINDKDAAINKEFRTFIYK